MNTNTDFKEGIKKLIAEYPEKYYVKNYLGTVL